MTEISLNEMQEIDSDLADEIRGGNQLPCWPDPWGPGPTFPTQPPTDPWTTPECW